MIEFLLILLAVWFVGELLTHPRRPHVDPVVTREPDPPEPKEDPELGDFGCPSTEDDPLCPRGTCPDCDAFRPENYT